MTEIISKGSRFTGQSPARLDELISMMSAHPLEAASHLFMPI